MGQLKDSKYLLEIIAKSSLQEFCISPEEGQEEFIKNPHREVPRLRCRSALGTSQ